MRIVSCIAAAAAAFGLSILEPWSALAGTASGQTPLDCLAHCYAQQTGVERALGEACFDGATGNLYIRNASGTYLQFSKTGVLLRDDVPPDQPRLKNSRDIIPVSPHAYILYEKNTGPARQLKILPSCEPHPMNGWKSKELLFALH
jgi:hypothetical protein